MKRVPVVAVLAMLAILGGDAVLAEPPASGSEIDIVVSTLRSRVGVLGCRLFKDPKGFPEKPPWFAQTGGPITAKTQSCHFADVPPGTYAVAVMHDENSNGKLDKSFIGKPVEGYGVSNNHTYALQSPEWAESKFEVKSGQKVKLAIELRY